LAPFRDGAKQKSGIQSHTLEQGKAKKNKQTINYLKSTNYQLGLLINFGQSSLTWKRFINTK